MMLENLFAQAGQSRIFLQMCLLGLAAGLLGDLTGSLGREHPILGAAGDMLVALGTAMGALGVLIAGGSGLRWYAALGLTLGAVLYHAGLRQVGRGAAGLARKFFRQAGNRPGHDESISNRA